MKLVRILAPLLIALSLLAIAAPAYAATSVEECQQKITDLRTATLNATFIGRNADKDQAGLVAKLDGALVKLSEGKYDDTLANLNQFRTKVQQLDAQGKINSEDAAILLAGSDDAIACVQNLSDGV